jgi:hypothetical protein
MASNTAASARRSNAFSPATALIPLLQDEPPALLVPQIKLRDGSGFGCLLIPRLNGPEVLPALADDRHPPASRFRGSGLLSRVLHGRGLDPNLDPMGHTLGGTTHY